MSIATTNLKLDGYKLIILNLNMKNFLSIMEVYFSILMDHHD